MNVSVIVKKLSIKGIWPTQQQTHLPSCSTQQLCCINQLLCKQFLNAHHSCWMGKLPTNAACVKQQSMCVNNACQTTLHIFRWTSSCHGTRSPGRYTALWCKVPWTSTTLQTSSQCMSWMMGALIQSSKTCRYAWAHHVLHTRGAT